VTASLVVGIGLLQFGAEISGLRNDHFLRSILSVFPGSPKIATFSVVYTQRKMQMLFNQYTKVEIPDKSNKIVCSDGN
jgi:hypothetical protein